jgi:hypothetical protein
MTKRMVLAAAIAAVAALTPAWAQDWDNKTVEKMLKEGTKKLESAKPDEREDGIGYIQGYIRCSDRAKFTPILVKALKDTNPKVRVSAVQTLEKLHAIDTVADVIPLLEDPIDDVKERALFTLGGFGADAKSAVPAIKKAQAAAKAAHKNGLEATTEEALGEIAGTKDNKRTKCS